MKLTEVEQIREILRDAMGSDVVKDDSDVVEMVAILVSQRDNARHYSGVWQGKYESTVDCLESKSK